MDSQTLEAAPPTPAALWEDFIDIFVSPREVFERRRDGTFGGAMIFLSIVLALLTVPTQMSLSGVFEAALQANLQNTAMGDLSPEQVQRVGSLSVYAAAIGTLFATPVLILLTGIVLGAAAWLVKLSIPMGAAIMIATYAAFPRLLGMVATMIQAFLIEPTRINQISIGPARFLGEGSNPVLAEVLTRFDLFALWGVALLAIGVSTVARTSGARGWVAALITWAVASIPIVASGIIAAARG